MSLFAEAIVRNILKGKCSYDDQVMKFKLTSQEQQEVQMMFLNVLFGVKNGS